MFLSTFLNQGLGLQTFLKMKQTNSPSWPLCQIDRDNHLIPNPFTHWYKLYTKLLELLSQINVLSLSFFTLLHTQVLGAPTSFQHLFRSCAGLLRLVRDMLIDLASLSFVLHLVSLGNPLFKRCSYYYLLCKWCWWHL